MKKYNGWTNFETWKINLEIFDGLELDYPMSHGDCQEFAENIIFDIDNTENSIMAGLAHNFLSEVDWREIAEHVNEYNENRIKI